MRTLGRLPRFRAAYASLAAAGDRERLSRAALDSLQLDRLNALWAHAARHVPHYRALKQERGLPPRFDSLAEFTASVPLLERDRVRADPQRLVSTAARPGRWRHTSGSTGPITKVYWEDAAHLEALQAKYRCLQAWGIDIFDRTAFLWGHADALRRGWRGHAAKLRQPVEDWLRNRMRLSAYQLGAPQLRRHLDRIRRFRPAMLYAYSTAAYLLAREAAACGIACDSLRLVVLSSEPARPYLIDTIEEAFKAPAIVEYGSIDAGLIAFEAPDRSLRVREDIVIVETLPAGAGGFDIVVTGLLNRGFPLIRYAIGDRTDEPLDRPAAGFARLPRLLGRSNDLLLSGTGEVLHPNWIDHLFKSEPAVRRWQIHQGPTGALDVLVETADGVDSIPARRLERRLRQALGGFGVRVTETPLIPPGASGKHRWITSDLRPDNLQIRIGHARA